MPFNQAKQAVIAMAVNELAHDHEFDSITVDMICKGAGISRSGFYRVFEDKYAVLLWCARFPLESGIAEIGRTFTIQQGVKVAIEGFDLFEDMFSSTCRSTERRTRENDGIEQAHRFICETITHYHGVSLDEDLDYQARWCARGTLLSIRDRHDPNEDAGILAARIAQCYPARLAKILDNPVDPAQKAVFDPKMIMLQ